MCRADACEQVAALRSLHIRKGKKEVLSRNKLVAQLLGVCFGFVENLVQFARKRGLGVRLLGIPRHLATDGLAKLRDTDAKLLHDGNDDPLVLREERHEQMQIVDERIPRASGEVNRLVERFACLYRQTVRIDHGGWL